MVNAGTWIDGYEFSPRLLAAAVSYAESDANRLAALLAEHFPPDKYDLNRADPTQLLEISAALQIGSWERQEIFKHVEHGLPTYAAALEQIEQRERLGAAGFQNLGADSLALAVFRFRIERMAWTKPEDWDSDVIISQVDDDAFLEDIADLLWRCKGQIVELLRGDANVE